MLAIYANIVYFHGFAYFCTPKVPVDSLGVSPTFCTKVTLR